MAAPIRNISDASPGQITATPQKTKNLLAIRLTKVRGVVSKGRRR
jgi:hypothetical protein